ncbi:hypothetical protein CIY_34590 [Butyrivibrio fibrisolvens 16/4]|nr:hypothetical protein CIY_34590 [Butyrivibrio fibrisolvens 16/4]
MKKRIMVLSMIFCMGLATIACGKEESAPETSEAVESVEQSVDDTASEETTESSEEVTEDEEDEEATNTTVWCGYLEASNKELSGEPDEYGVIRAIIYDAHLDGDTFTLEGTLNFKNVMSQDPIGMVPGDVNTFKVDENTKYLLHGGEAGPEEKTREEFEEIFKGLLDSGLFFEVELENGVAKTVNIRS